MIYLLALSLIFIVAFLWREREHKAERQTTAERHNQQVSLLLNRIQAPEAAPYAELQAQNLSVDPNDDGDQWAAYEEREALSG